MFFLNFENNYCETNSEDIIIEDDYFEFDYDNWEMDSLYFEDVLPIELSSGWFPKVIFTGKNSFFILSGTSRFNLADNITSNSFIPTTNSFSSNTPKSKTLETRRKFSNKTGKNKEQIFKNNGAYESDFRFLLKPINTFLVFKTGLSIEINQLFSVDKSRSFIDYDGEEKQFKEISIIQIDELNIKNSFFANIPIYGGFIKDGDDGIASFYYLTLGISTTYPMYSDGSQFMQIGDKKSEIRYDNGLIRQTLFKDKRLKTLNDWKYYYVFGVGWEVNTHIQNVRYELQCAYRANSALSDAKWKSFDINLNLCFSWNILFSLFK